MPSAKITWTKCDEAPALASYALLPIIEAFARGSGVEIETADISLAGRILANFPDKLRADQKIPDELSRLGDLAKTPQANIIKLPNISASIPQLQAAIAELQAQGYDIPKYPEEPKNDAERALQARFAVVLGSAVNPVLREGNSDRRPAASVKKFAQKHPHKMMKAWPKDGSKTRVAHMDDKRLLRQRNLRHPGRAHRRAHRVRGWIRRGEGAQGQARAARRRGGGRGGDERRRPARLLRRTDRAGQAGRRAALDPPQVHHDEGLGPHHVRPLRVGVFQGRLQKHAAALKEIGANVNNGLADVIEKLDRLPADKKKEIEADINACYQKGPALAMVDSRKGKTNLHVPNDIIVDASMPVVIRDGGQMWNKDDALQDTIAMIPDRCYAGIYQAIIEDCQQRGQFDPATMGDVSNVGLMAMKAEEYGSHDKTFVAPASGTMRVVDAGGRVLLEQPVERGDIFRACQARDEAIVDWVRLAVERARATKAPTVFWLDEKRGHDAEIIKKVKAYLPKHDTDRARHPHHEAGGGHEVRPRAGAARPGHRRCYRQRAARLSHRPVSHSRTGNQRAHALDCAAIERGRAV